MENRVNSPLFSEGGHYGVAGNFSGHHFLNDVMAVENSHVQQHISPYLSESADEDIDITLGSLQKLAKSSGVKASEKMSQKIELIWAIQMATYHQPCFGTELRGACKKEDCNWRYECKKPVTEHHACYS